MYNHAPKDYKCPLCITASGIDSEYTMAKQDDILYRDADLVVMVNSKFVPGNEGHLIIFPIQHFENLYEMDDVICEKVFVKAKEMAILLKKVRKCDGVMLQQNNEPASGQHAFHFHLHIYPRFDNDKFLQNQKKVYVAEPSERNKYAGKYRKYLAR